MQLHPLIQRERPNPDTENRGINTQRTPDYIYMINPAGQQEGKYEKGFFTTEIPTQEQV